MKEILVSIRMSIMVNGSPTKEFSPRRGLRQGDPVAPYLFLIVGEVLSKLIDRAKERGQYSGIKFPFQKDSITHFQYADDTILFVENDARSIRKLKTILLLFQVITGLSINFDKSHVYHVSNDTDKVKEGLEILGCKSDRIPFKYLGTWVGQDKKSCDTWSPLKNIMMKKFGGWKCNWLNMAGRMELIKSNLNSIPNYWFSLRLIPKSTCSELEKIRRSFLWGELAQLNDKHRKMHLLKWDQVCARKEVGGLNLSRLELKNLVLLAKWW